MYTQISSESNGWCMSGSLIALTHFDDHNVVFHLI